MPTSTEPRIITPTPLAIDLKRDDVVLSVDGLTYGRGKGLTVASARCEMTGPYSTDVSRVVVAFKEIAGLHALRPDAAIVLKEVTR